MILNLSKIKTESLLLFCRDLILSYKDKDDIEKYLMDKEVIEKFNNIGNDMLKQISNVRKTLKGILKRYHFLWKPVDNSSTEWTSCTNRLMLKNCCNSSIV